MAPIGKPSMRIHEAHDLVRILVDYSTLKGAGDVGGHYHAVIYLTETRTVMRQGFARCLKVRIEIG
jgi:hypothetical protein